MQLRSLVLASLSIFAASDAFAAIKEWKYARANDIASKYELETDGDFYRIVDGKRCQITNNVQDFKISSHPNDAAVAYYIQSGDLYYLKNSDSTSRNCPRADRDRLMEDVKKIDGEYKYSVVPNTKTVIVNMALSRSGTFSAWPNSGRPVLTAGNGIFRHRAIVDYTVNNQNFGVAGKPFSSYVAFALDNAGCILKVKGVDTASSNWDNDCGYDTIAEFKNKHNIR